MHPCFAYCCHLQRLKKLLGITISLLTFQSAPSSAQVTVTAQAEFTTVIEAYAAIPELSLTTDCEGSGSQDPKCWKDPELGVISNSVVQVKEDTPPQERYAKVVTITSN